MTSAPHTLFCLVPIIAFLAKNLLISHNQLTIYNKNYNIYNFSYL